MRKSSILLALMAMSPAAFSQTYTRGDLDNIYEPPANIQGTICAHTTNDGNQHSYKACSDGVAAARWMAEKYAQSTGQYLGCVNGIQQGVYDGFIASRDASQEVKDQAAAYVANADMKSALARAQQDVAQHAETESADQIIARYRKVVGVKKNGAQVLPDKTPNMPSIKFKGYTDGYVYDQVGTGFDKAIDAGFVSRNDSIEDKFKGLEVYNFAVRNPNSPCDSKGTVFAKRNYGIISWNDYFRAKRIRRFEDYGWNNANWAWEIYDRDERNIDHYQNYDGISNLEKTVTITTPIFETKFKRDANGDLIPVLDAEGNHKVDAEGNKMYETEEVFVRNDVETKVIKLPTNEVAALQSEYRKAFTESYSRHFARKYVSIKFNTESESKYTQGKQIGESIGQLYAGHIARMSAYDTRYRQTSKEKYIELAEQKYLDSFNRLISIFENNPVVELTGGHLTGTKNDGIYRAGEQLVADIRVKNLGEVARPITIKLGNSSDVIPNQNGHTFTPAALDETVEPTGVLGQISGDIRARENINVLMTMINPSNLNEIASELNATENQAMTIRDYAEVENISTSIDTLNGKLDVRVKLVNPATIETPALPVLTVEAGNKIQTKNMMKIEADGEVTKLVTFDGLDPLALINSDGVNVGINVKVGEKVTDTGSKRQTNMEGRRTLIAKYFHQVANEENTNYGDDTRQERLQKLLLEVEEYMDSAIRRVRRWKKQDQVNGTILGDLQSLVKASRLTTEGKRVYDKLADTLARKVNNKGEMKIKGRDKFYLKALKRISKKVSTNWKDYRE